MNIELSNEQQIAYNKYIQGKNIFITGPGGSGKSELIRKIFENSKKNKKKIQITALTGRAALLLNCEARTLHSWAGIGLGKGPIEQIIKKVCTNIRSLKNWKSTSVLVVDEVSMLSYKLFELLDKIGRTIRGASHLPFGGIQLIFTGDFFQLPPVGNRDDPESSKFCFESELWNETFDVNCQIQLKKIFRQKDDEYAKILNQIREGKITRKSCDKLTEHVGRVISPDLLIKPTKLLPTRNQVDTINSYEMALIENSETVQYQIKFCNNLPMTEDEKKLRIHFSEAEIEYELKYMHDNMVCDDIINIKIGANVMCLINIPGIDDSPMLCNGSQGVVIRISALGFPVVKFGNGCEREMGPHIWLSERIPGIGLSQIPLILAWAITIHKSQGSTLYAAEIDAGNGIFECGQTYVALSRVKSLDGLYLTSFNPSKILVNKKVKAFYANLNANLNYEPEPELEPEPEPEPKPKPELEPEPEIKNIFSNFEYSETVSSRELEQEQSEVKEYELDPDNFEQ
uniref:AAA+ ATPase domain-containing protein n=1 Tax=viral metagenome TaxID=1070528 RepID=A0A6C0KWC5_9ZZZZ